MRAKTLFLYVGIYCLIPVHEQFGFGGSSAPLYSSSDRGITLINFSNFSQTIHESDTAWMVEFYSSWCGHCIRFAPQFKELGLAVEGWQSMIKLAAIDCAQDENVAICRDYEIMGYPSLKFFPPQAEKSDLGELRESMNKEIPLMMQDMAAFMDKLSKSESLTPFWTENHWPNLAPIKDEPLESIWNGHNGGASNALVIAEEAESPLGIYAMLEMHSKKQEDEILVRRGHSLTEPLFSLLKATRATHPLVVLSIEKGHESSPSIVYNGDSKSWTDLRKALHDHRLRRGQGGGRSQGNAALAVEDPQQSKVLPPQQDDKTHRVTTEDEIRRRRYTAFMTDIENAILYSLSHEIGSRTSIVGPSLDALREYTEVLDSHFPGRPDTMLFIHHLRNWVASHTDAIRGEDLIAEINDLRASTGAFVDTPNGLWMGCRGSKPVYGGYPCSLWTLWHVLTVNQRGEETPRHRVLGAMVGYVKHFFGCEDCARHFLLEAEDGDAVRREVVDKRSSILWLWKVHNRANRRLSGDLTDDKAFPKEVFPNREHCSDCYNNRLGSDLWSEFDHDKVVHFLNELYGEESLSHRGLKMSAARHNKPHIQHEVVVYQEEQDKTKHNDYLREKNNALSSSSSFFWGPMDISLCFSIYLLSAVILVAVYLKFVAKRNICASLIYNGLFKHHQATRSMHNVV